jgi:hypothetical protein
MHRSMRCLHYEVPLITWPLHYRKLDDATEAEV